jgi:ParB family chromosome partitioning protein
VSDTQKSNRKLGRGLSSLLGSSDLPVHREVVAGSEEALAPTPPGVVESERSADRADGPWIITPIPASQIRPNPHQPRRDFDPQSLQGLSDSIRANGLIQPILVRQVAGGFELIAGERRLRAAQMAGLAMIPAIVRSADPVEQAQLALIENIQREDLNPIDRALAYSSLMKSLGVTQVELASRLGEDRSGIANHLRLLDLTDDVRDLVRARQLSVGHAKLLAGIGDAREQLRLARLVVDQGLSVRNLERVLSNVDVPDKRPPSKGQSPHVRDLERMIQSQLGMRVQLRTRGKKTGRLVIHYANLEQFDDLMVRMGIRLEV